MGSWLRDQLDQAVRPAMASGLCFVLIIGATAAQAKPTRDTEKNRTRIETKAYDAPSTAVWLGFLYYGNCNPGPTEHTDGCVRFTLKPSDRFISFKIEDRTGQPVFATVWSSNDTDIASFCGETEAPIPSPGTEFVYVEFPANASSDCSPSTATQGTLTATFVRIRK